MAPWTTLGKKLSLTLLTVLWRLKGLLFFADEVDVGCSLSFLSIRRRYAAGECR